MRPHPQRVVTTGRSDPAVVSFETPPVVNKGSNDVPASVDYLRERERALLQRTAGPIANTSKPLLPQQ